MSWYDRIDVGTKWERDVAERLQAVGYLCKPYGQALLDEEMRRALREARSPIRYIADLVAVRNQEAILVDPKTCIKEKYRDPDWPNIAIEVDCHKANSLWEPHTGIRVLFVHGWPGMTVEPWVADAHLLPPKRVMHVTRTRYSSGTDQYLYQKTEWGRFSEFFGHPTKRPLDDQSRGLTALSLRHGTPSPSLYASPPDSYPSEEPA